MNNNKMVNHIMTEMKDSDEKLHELDLIIAESDEKGDVSSAYHTRMLQNEVAVSIGRYDILMENFAWCLDVYEEHPLEFQADLLLKNFFLFLRHIHFFPLIGKEEIDEYYGYYLQLLLKNDYSLRSYYQLRVQLYQDSGDTEGVLKYFDLWLEADRDGMSDCVFCEKQLMMLVLFELGKVNEAFKIAQELLASKSKCKDVPHTVYPYLLLPAWNTDRTEEAKMWQEQGYFLLRKNPKRIVELSHMLLFLSSIDIKKAYELFRTHIQMADESSDLHSRFYFYLASWCMLEQAHKKRFSLPDEDADWFAEHVPLIAEEFDDRNNNHYYKSIIVEWRTYIGF